MTEYCSNQKMSEHCTNRKTTKYCNNQKMIERCRNQKVYKSCIMSCPLDFCKHKVCKRDKFDIYFSIVCEGTLQTIFLPTDQICQICISCGGALGHKSSFQLSFPGDIYPLSMLCFMAIFINMYQIWLNGSPDCFVIMIL
jgi:hypothetical protein